jgi:hypothetical protein
MISRKIAESDAAISDPQPAQSLRFYRVRLTSREAWFGATVAAIFNAIGMLIQIAIIDKIPGIPRTPAELSAFFAAILLMTLFVQRKAPSIRWAYISYLLTTVSVVTALLLTNLRFAIAERHWVPFQATKLGCLAAAMVAPGFWVGLLSILAYCLSAVIQFEFFFPPELRVHAPDAEPWPTLAFGLCGVLALVYRFRRAQLEQELARIQAQNMAIRRLAAIFLNIRDRMNTPLQVIELSVGLLRQSHQPPAPILDRIDRSVDSLREINTVLVKHEKEIEWETKG